MDKELELLEMIRWGLVLENTSAPRLLLRSLNCYEDTLIQHAGWTFYIFRMSLLGFCFVFNLNFCYFRPDILDKQLPHVQGWKDFPAAEAVTGTLGNVPKCLTDWFPYCSSKHWQEWGRQGTAGMWQLPVIMLLKEGVEGGWSCCIREKQSPAMVLFCHIPQSGLVGLTDS